MEYDYRAIAGKSAYVVEYLLTCELARIIAGHQIVHHNIVMLFQSLALMPADEAVGRPEEGTVDERGSLRNITQVTAGIHLHALKVVHGVVAVGVAASAYFFQQLRMAAYIVADHEECGLYAVAVEQIENPGGLFRYGAVVEGQIYHRASATLLYTPNRLREKEAI